MRIAFLQHVPFEGLGSIYPWLMNSSHTLQTIRLFSNDGLPHPDEFDSLIVMGGPMGIYDYEVYPWLQREKKLIERTLISSKKILGICLGAQLIADVLGASVEKNQHKEIGWFDVEKTKEAKQSNIDSILPEKIEVFHWHGDTFSIPKGAKRLYKSEACDNQAFIYQEKVLALQFHLEMMYPNCEDIIKNGLDELTPDRYVQKADEMLSDLKRFNYTNDLMNKILKFMFTDIQGN